MFGEIKERVPLSYFVSSLTAGKSLAGKENCSNKVINSGAVTFDEFDKKSFKNLPCDYIPKLEHKINSGDILISRMNTPLLVGAVAYVWNVEDNMYLPDRIWKANLRINADPVFLWKSLVAPEAKDFIRSWAGGTSGSMVNISKTKMLETPIIKAPLKLQKEFHQFVAKINKSKFRSWAGGTSGSMVNISKTKMLETPIIKAPLKLQKEFHQFVAKINKSKFIRPINA